MIELARQLGPNKITQQGPPFLPYDPWAQRHGIQREEEQRLEQMTRIAQQQARDEPQGFPDAYKQTGKQLK